MQFYLSFNSLYPYLVYTSSLTPAKYFLILLNRQTHAEFGMSHALMRPLLALRISFGATKPIKALPRDFNVLSSNAQSRAAPGDRPGWLVF